MTLYTGTWWVGGVTIDNWTPPSSIKALRNPRQLEKKANGMALNIEQARFNMIEQQIRTWDVLDQRVLETLKTVPREEFVPSTHRRMAFMDVRIPLGHDQVMMKPVEEGRLLQALKLEPGQTVLEIGTGSGFLAACLSDLGGLVTSLEIFDDLAEAATRRLERAGVANVSVTQADAFDPTALPAGEFDCVVVTGSSAMVPVLLKDKVALGGRLFAIQGAPPAMEAVCLHRIKTDQWQTDSLFETDLPRLLGAEDVRHFEF